MRRNILALLVLAPFAATALAQPPGPAKPGLEFLGQGPVKLIVPFAAGGGVDTAARLIAKQLQTDTGVPVIVDNRTGGSGVIGGRAVQMAAPDGQTLLFSAATHVLTKLVLANPPYDPQTDFTPVARVGEAPLLMVISPSLPQKKVGEVLDAMKREPDKWTAGLPALGAPSHIGTLLLAKQGPVTLTTVAYKGTAPALTDVAGGHTQVLVDSIISLMPMVKAGKVKAIAVTSKKRTAIAPDVPTAAESGYPGLVHASWYGVWAPKGLAPARQQALIDDDEHGRDRRDDHQDVAHHRQKGAELGIRNGERVTISELDHFIGGTCTGA